MDIVELHNFSDKDFTCKFDNRDYTVPAKDKITLTGEVANHVAFHMAKRVLMDRLLTEDRQFTKAEARTLAATYVTPLGGAKVDEPVVVTHTNKPQKVADVTE